MNWSTRELKLIEKYKDLIERNELVALLQAFSKEGEIGEGTSNNGLRIVFSILMVEPRIPFFLGIDWGMIYLQLHEHGGVIEGAPYDGVVGSPEGVREIVMDYFEDPGFNPNPYKDLPKDKLKALVDRAKIVWE